jgi:hypothetical protein
MELKRNQAICTQRVRSCKMVAQVGLVAQDLFTVLHFAPTIRKCFILTSSQTNTDSFQSKECGRRNHAPDSRRRVFIKHISPTTFS